MRDQTEHISLLSNIRVPYIQVVLKPPKQEHSFDEASEHLYGGMNRPGHCPLILIAF